MAVLHDEVLSDAQLPPTPLHDPPVKLEATFEFGKAVITCMVCVNGSELVFALDASFRVLMFDPRRKQVVRHFQLPVKGGFCSDWNSDGRFVAVGNQYGIEVYDVWTGKCLAKIPPRIRYATCLAWSPENSFLAIGEGCIRLWNTATERYEVMLEGSGPHITAMAWSRDARLLAAADRRGVSVWNVETGDRIIELPAHTNMVTSLSWSYDSHYLAMPVYLRGTHVQTGLTVFDAQSGNVVFETECPPVSALRFHPSGLGDFLLTKAHGEVRIWKIGSWECLCVIPEESGNHTKTSVVLHLYRDFFCTLGKRDTAIRVWKYDLNALKALTAPCVPDTSSQEIVSFSDSVTELGAEYDKGKLTNLVKKVETAQQPKEKGDALEILCKEILQLSKGFKVTGNVVTVTEEIDLVLQNWHQDVAWLERHGFYILGECKNWSTRCGKNEFVLFEKKLRNRKGHCTLGFLISWNGFADTVELEGLRGSKDDPIVVLLDGADIKEIADKGNLLEVLLRAYEKVVMR